MPEAIAKPHILKGDTVVLRRGREKGKRGTVKAVFPKEGTATVEGLNVVKRHSKQGMDGAKSAGIYEKEAPIPISALQLIDPKTNLPTRMRRIRKENGDTVRVARSGEEFLAPAKGR
jgi:large subunit ribosomal protein L24